MVVRREEEIEGDLRGWSVGGGERQPCVVAALGAVDGGEASGSSLALGGASEEVLAASRAASWEYALVPRQGGRRAAVPQPVRSGGAVVFGPQTQEEAALDAFSRRL